jgi:hypothetical protein
MNRKRSRFDPLAVSTAARWLITLDHFQNTIDATELPAGIDLRRAFNEAMESLRREGWTIEEPFFSSVFVHRDDVRHMLTIVPNDPSKPTPIGNTQFGGTLRPTE